MTADRTGAIPPEGSDERRPVSAEPPVLIVDDNPDHAFLTAQALRQNDPPFASRIAGDGAACLEAIKQQTPAAIVMDYHLPDTDGLSLLAKVSDLVPFVPVVLVTGEGSEEVAVSAMKLGAADYVVKAGEYFKGLPPIIAMSIEHFRQMEEAQRQWSSADGSLIPLLFDASTAVFSREAFSAIAELVIGEAVRRQTSLSLILVALDQAPNAGETTDSSDAALLPVVASVLQRTARHSDAIGRLETTAFAILAQDAERTDAIWLCWRIRTALPKQVTVADREIPLTVPIGVASVSQGAKALPELLGDAQEALTRAIELGGNSIQVSGLPDGDYSKPVPPNDDASEQLAVQRRQALAELTQAFQRGEIEGIAIRTQPGACPTCIDVARDLYMPQLTPPLPLLGCSGEGGCRCTYILPMDDARRRPPPIPAERFPGLNIPGKLRDAAFFGSDPKRGCKPDDMAEYLDAFPLLPFATELELQAGEAAYVLRPARRAWERPTAESAATHGPSFPLSDPFRPWVKQVKKAPFLPSDALPIREEGALCLTNWRLIFQKFGKLESILLADIADIEYLRDGFACSIGTRSNRLVYLMRDSLQIGLCVARAMKDIADLPS